MKTTARNQCLKCGAILELPDSLAAGLCMECRQKAAPEPRQETRWQLEAQVKAAEQQLAQKNQQLLDSDNTIARLQSERAELLAACKAAERALQCHIGKECLADHFPMKLQMLRAAIAQAERGQS